MHLKQINPLIIGCHHKTGTMLLAAIVKTLRSQRRSYCNLVVAAPHDRKLPFSLILQDLKAKHLNKPCWYIDIWFEHEMDITPSSVRFLHFVRHPADRIRSAYLYHAKGAPNDTGRWLDWRIFSVFNKAVSYCELLNIVDDKVGLLIEALRSYPEIAGTARAAKTSDHLTQRLQISLEQIAANYDANIRKVCEFMGLGKTSAKIAANALRQHDLSKMHKNDVPNHVTRYNPKADQLKRYLLEDPLFHKLYSQCVEETGFECCSSQRRKKSLVNDDIVANILNSKTRLLTDLRTELGHADIRSGLVMKDWLPYALQAFGPCGHLMMYEFIQTFIDSLDLQESQK